MLLGSTLLASVVALAPDSPSLAFPANVGSSFVIAKEIEVGNGPSDIVVSPDGDFVYVTNRDDDSVSIIDASAGTVETIDLDEDDEPVAIAVTPGGDFVYVANIGGGSPGGGSVTVIDTATEEVVEKFDLGGDADDVPSDIAISPDGSLAYITLPDNDDVVYVDTAADPMVVTGSITQAGGNFDGPTSVAFVPPGEGADPHRAIVGNADAVGTQAMSYIDTADNEVIRNFGHLSGNGASGGALKVTVSPTGLHGLYTPTTNLADFHGPGVGTHFNPAGPGTRISSIGLTPVGTIGGFAYRPDGEMVYYVYGEDPTDVAFSENRLGRATVPGLGGYQPNTFFSFTTSPTGLAATPTTNSGFPLYVLHESTDKVTVLVEATPVLDTTSGPSGSTVTISLNIEEAGFEIDDDAVIGVRFDGTLGTDLTASTGNTWTVTAPAGTGTVPVDVSFKLSGRVEGTSPWFNNRSRAADAFSYVGGGVGIKRATFDPAGGVCGVNSGVWTVEFHGTYPLPTPSECRRDGHALLGWTSDPKPAGTGQLLSAVVNRPRIMTAVWGILPPAPARVDVFANFLCNQCTAAIVLWPASSEPSDTAVVSIGNVERTCVASGSLFALRWCWVTGLASRSTHVASVAWRNTNGVGPSANTSFGLR